MGLVSVFYTQVIPVGLWVVMLGLGLSLTPQNIGQVFAMPKAIAVGLAGQLILLPALALLIGILIAPTPAIAVGALVLAACPGGVTSNAYTFASRGDVALSVTLTALSSLVAVFTVPLVTFFALDFFVGAGAIPALPAGLMTYTLAKMTVVPVLIGMILRYRWAKNADRIVAILRQVTFLFLIVLVVTGSILAIDVMKQHFTQTLAVALALNVLSMTLGFWLGWMFRLPISQRVAITYEVGVQNVALASLVALTLLGNEQYFIVAIIYAAIMKATAMGFMCFARHWVSPEESAAIGAAPGTRLSQDCGITGR